MEPVAITFNSEVIGYFVKDLPKEQPKEFNTVCPNCGLTFMAKPVERNDFLSLQQKIVGGK